MYRRSYSSTREVYVAIVWNFGESVSALLVLADGKDRLHMRHATYDMRHAYADALVLRRTLARAEWGMECDCDSSRSQKRKIRLADRERRTIGFSTGEKPITDSLHPSTARSPSTSVSCLVGYLRSRKNCRDANSSPDVEIACMR